MDAMMDFSYRFEQLSSKISVCVTPEHKFGTDAFLLADFAGVRKKDVVCDLGTGCGIIPLFLTKIAAPRKIYGVDIQPQAIEQLKLSLEYSHLDHIVPLCLDLKELAENNSCIPAGSVDVVTCNPPYKANRAGILSELTAEQIARHEVMCTIEDVCRAASRMLKYGGKVCICQRPERLADVVCAMRQADLEPKRLRFVAKHAGETPWLFLIEGKKGSRPFLQMLPTLPVYEPDGKEFSAEMQAVYHWEEKDHG